MAELGWTGPDPSRGVRRRRPRTSSTWSWCSRRWAARCCPGRSSPPSILGGGGHRSTAAATAQKKELPAEASPTGDAEGDARAARADRPLGRRRHRAAGQAGRRRLRARAAPSCSCPTRTTPTCSSSRRARRGTTGTRRRHAVPRRRQGARASRRTLLKTMDQTRKLVRGGASTDVAVGKDARARHGGRGLDAARPPRRPRQGRRCAPRCAAARRRCSR